MLTCSHCQAENPDEARFCRECGREIARTSAAGVQSTDPTRLATASRWHYLAGAIVIVAGAVSFGIFLFIRLMGMMPEIQVVVPGEHEIHFSDSGTYTVFYEYRSEVDGRVYATTQSLSGLLVALRSKDDFREVTLSSPSASTEYSFGGRSGVSVLKFDIDEPGTYILNADYPPGADGPDVVLAIGQLNLLRTILIALAIFFVPLIAGAFVIVRAFLQRRKATRESAATA